MAMATVFHSLATICILAGTAILVWAALHDVMARTAPNAMPLAIAAAGLLGQGCAAIAWVIRGPDWLSRVPQALTAVSLSLFVAIVIFVLMALLWRRGWIGGADVKLLAAAALLLPASAVPSMVVAISLAGGAVSAVFLAARGNLPRPAPGRRTGLLARVWKAERWRMRRGAPVPYAVAIASGVVFVLSKGGLP